jgi:hypothetical protein
VCRQYASTFPEMKSRASHAPATPDAKGNANRSKPFCYHQVLPRISLMDDIPSIRIPAEAFMDEVPTLTAGARRNEDIALDLMKFVAMTTGYGRTTSSGVGFQGGGAASKPEDYAGHLLELYTKCLHTVQQKRGA